MGQYLLGVTSLTLASRSRPGRANRRTPSHGDNVEAYSHHVIWRPSVFCQRCAKGVGTRNVVFGNARGAKFSRVFVNERQFYFPSSPLSLFLYLQVSPSPRFLRTISRATRVTSVFLSHLSFFSNVSYPMSAIGVFARRRSIGRVVLPTSVFSRVVFVFF